ncbi:unnamed protein product [Dicrocoelium dendriticum]|nr:unnamed protein product [Dicrocoelium dendriticum]
MRFGGSSRRMHYRPDVGNLQHPATLAKYQATLSTLFASSSDDGRNSQWMRIKDCQYCQLWNCLSPAEKLDHHYLLVADRHRLIPTDTSYSNERRFLDRALRMSLQKDRETWWCERVREMKLANLSDNTRKRLHLIRVTKASDLK